jgi:hypothetical protein
MQDAIQDVQIQEVQEDDSSWEAYTGSTDLSSDESHCEESDYEEYGDEARYAGKRSRSFVS